MPTSGTRAALAAAAEGLTYQSETDAPWRAFHWPDQDGEPTADGVKRRGHHRASAEAAEEPLDAFFAPLVADEDWHGAEEKAEAERYRALLAAVRGALVSPKVVRVGPRKVAVYVVGAAAEGGWAGLKTTAVET